MAERCAIVGIGISDHKRVRADLSMPGLLREAAQRALDDAEMGWDDIEAVVFGKAPDQFEGVMQPELFLSDAMGCAGKPMIRMHTAGSVGAHTAIFGAHLIESGLFESYGLSLTGSNRGVKLLANGSPAFLENPAPTINRLSNGIDHPSEQRAVYATFVAAKSE